MACIGVPSIISRNGNLTWPELSAKKVLYEVDWDNLDAIANLIIKDIEIPSTSTIQYCRDIINISHNIQQHLEVGCITR
jgi:hypothetical protein